MNDAKQIMIFTKNLKPEEKQTIKTNRLSALRISRFK